MSNPTGLNTSKDLTTKHILNIGEPSKHRFEGIILSDAATESNFIRSNGLFTAVSSSYPISISSKEPILNIILIDPVEQ